MRGKLSPSTILRVIAYLGDAFSDIINYLKNKKIKTIEIVDVTNCEREVFVKDMTDKQVIYIFARWGECLEKTENK